MSHAPISNRADRAKSDAQRKAVRESNHKFGVISSLVGGAFALLAFIIVFGSGFLSLWMQAHKDTLSETTTTSLHGITSLALGATPGVFLLFAMCGLILGEQLRRGSISGSKTVNRNVSEFAILPLRWHGFWFVVTAIISGVLVGTREVAAIQSWDLDNANDFTEWWMAYGVITGGISAVVLASFIKKVIYLHHYNSGKVDSLESPSIFWRTVTYRWRLDLWTAAIGGLLFAASFSNLTDIFRYPTEQFYLDKNLPSFIAVLVGGIAVFIFSIVCSAQFWRSGESIGSGESV